MFKFLKISILYIIAIAITSFSTFIVWYGLSYDTVRYCSTYKQHTTWLATLVCSKYLLLASSILVIALVIFTLYLIKRIAQKSWTKIVLIFLCLIIIFAGCLYVSNARTYNNMIVEYTAQSKLRKSRIINKPSYPSDEVISKSQISTGCSTGYVPAEMASSYRLILTGDGKVNYKSAKHATGNEKDMSKYIDPTEYKKLLLHAYDINIFALQKMHGAMLVDAGDCSIRFLINGQQTSLSWNNLYGLPEAEEVSAYVKMVSEAVNLSGWSQE